ncbi:MAG TPA: helix-turn-helix transcriptional regulator, partial [Acidobacteriota bacterium]|nr:helix-turn-helix transcriptional regulator [Acidobacteriota bacterium]
MPTDPVSDFVASTIRRIRIEKGIRVADMAWRTGIPLGSYSCLETGRYRMSLENLFRILHILGTDINQVWPGEITEWVEQVDEGFIERWVEKARSNQPPQVAM